jgi:hypothetical protein
MIKQSLLVVALLCPFMNAGEKTGKFLYYLTKGTCYTGATAAIVGGGTVLSSVALGSMGITALGTTAISTGPVATVGLGSMAPACVKAPVIISNTQKVAIAALAASESLAQKAYEFGKKF